MPSSSSAGKVGLPD